MDTVALVARLNLSAVFAFSAGAKLANPAGFTNALAAFGVDHPRVVSRLLPLVEGGLAAVLIAFPDHPGPGWAALGMLGLVTGVVVGHLRTGRAAPCPCFAASGTRPVSATTVVRNGLLGGLALVATGSSTGAHPVAVGVATVLTVPVTVYALRRFG